MMFWRNVLLIFRREYKNQVTRRSFLVTTVICAIILILVSLLPTIIAVVQAHANAQPSPSHLVVIDHAGEVAGMSGRTLLQFVETSASQESSSPVVASLAANRTLPEVQDEVKSGRIDGVLVLDRMANQALRFTYYTTDSSTVQVQSVITELNILDMSTRLGLNQAQIKSLFAQPAFTVTTLQNGQLSFSTADRVTGLLLAYLGIILMVLTNIFYDQAIAQGVAEEKGHRIIEVLMLATTPDQLMAGKILGIGAAGLTQMGGLVALSIGLVALQNPLHALFLGSTSGGLEISLTGAAIKLLLLVLLYFMLSFALFSSLYAAAGALVQQQDEARNAIMPVMLLFLIGYILSMSILPIPSVPNQLWFRVLSFIPFWTPTTMLVRISVSTISWWEIPATVVLMILTGVLCAWISARIYRYGVLSYGQRFRLSQLARVIRAG